LIKFRYKWIKTYRNAVVVSKENRILREHPSDAYLAVALAHETGNLRIHQGLLQSSTQTRGVRLEKSVGFRTKARLNEFMEQNENVTGPTGPLRNAKAALNTLPNYTSKPADQSGAGGSNK